MATVICKHCGGMLIKSWQTKDRFFWIHNTTPSKMMKRLGKLCKRPVPKVTLNVNKKEDGFPPNNKLLGIQPTIL